MALPPLLGATKAIEACPAPAVATTEVGAPGTVNGVAVNTDEEAPAPAVLLARTATE